MEASTTDLSKDDMVKLLQAVERRIAQQDNYINQMSERFEQMGKRIELCNRIAHARTRNSLVRGSRATLYPIPLPNGDDVPKDQFPATYGDFFDLPDQAARNLVVQYGLASSDDVPEATDDKLKILAEHWGVPCADHATTDRTAMI